MTLPAVFDRSGRLTPWLAAVLCAAVAALAWFGYRAANAWEQSSSLLVERRENEIADMLVTALGRDMRSVQTSVLESVGGDARILGDAAEMSDVVAAAFARYPYPEVFFSWLDTQAPPRFFARTDRMPMWLAQLQKGRAFPVESISEPRTAATLIARVSQDAASVRRYSVFNITVGGIEYQAVVRNWYAGSHLQGGIGFLVNLPWVSEHYFSQITIQVTSIARAGEGLRVAVLDEKGGTIAGVSGTRLNSNAAQRPLPILFFDPSLTILDQPQDLPVRTWSIRVDASSDPTVLIAAAGARRTLVVLAVGALAVGIGLWFTVRAARATAHIAALRSDFVSTVTHELKTPVQVIRGIGETFIRGRVQTPERLHEYSVLLMQEGHRLSRLIDNLLAYSRVTDVTQLYNFQQHQPDELVDEALKGFRRLISEGAFELSVSTPADLPPIRADRTAFVLALDNLIDNAMRYSEDSRTLNISADEKSGYVRFHVADRGRGIPADELPRVTQRFRRGRSSTGSGSGLGLAIVNRIAADHRGFLKVTSTPGVGTTATLAIPVWS